MPSTIFVLKEPQSYEPTLIYLIFRFNNVKLKYSFNQKINPKFWNPEKQRVKETRQFTEYSEFAIQFRFRQTNKAKQQNKQ